jgi:hypothetical protein
VRCKEVTRPETKPDAVSCNSLINCWAKSRQNGAADRAEAILREMQNRYKAGDKDVEPNIISYASVILAWSHSRQRDSVVKAESLMNEMLSLAEAGNKNVAPDVRVYNHVLSAIAASGLPDGTQRASKIIKIMKENGISPDEYTRKIMAKFTIGLGRSGGDR